MLKLMLIMEVWSFHKIEAQFSSDQIENLTADELTQKKKTFGTEINPAIFTILKPPCRQQSPVLLLAFYYSL